MLQILINIFYGSDICARHWEYRNATTLVHALMELIYIKQIITSALHNQKEMKHATERFNMWTNFTFLAR